MSLSAEERLIPVRVKVKRAKKHVADLEKAAEDYRDAYAHVVDRDAGGMRKLPIIHFDMLAIAGDALHNLRSALDHVVYNLALVANPNVSDETLRTVAFPIGKSREEYPHQRTREILDGGCL